jgi:hypothetical protein
LPAKAGSRFGCANAHLSQQRVLDQGSRADRAVVEHDAGSHGNVIRVLEVGGERAHDFSARCDYRRFLHGTDAFVTSRGQVRIIRWLPGQVLHRDPPTKTRGASTRHGVSRIDRTKSLDEFIAESLLNLNLQQTGLRVSNTDFPAFSAIDAHRFVENLAETATKCFNCLKVCRHRSEALKKSPPGGN